MEGDLHSREFASASLARFPSHTCTLHPTALASPSPYLDLQVLHLAPAQTPLSCIVASIFLSRRFHFPSFLPSHARSSQSTNQHARRQQILTRTPIQCDETHPTCNNCKKSKRDCLGYDPIFKQQGQTASNLQPAPNGNISPPASVTDSSAPYTTHPTPILTPSEPTSATTDDSAPTVKVEDIENKTHANIDPALPASFTAAHSGSNGINSTEFSQQSGDALHLRGAVPLFDFTPSSSPSPTFSYPVSQKPLPSHSPSARTHAYSNAPVKMKVDEIVNQAGAAPEAPRLGEQVSPEALAEITQIYHEIYVPGLSSFFESDWFSFPPSGSHSSHNPISILHNNRPLVSLMASFLVQMKTANAQNFGYCTHLETRVVWALAKLAYTVPPGSNAPRDNPPRDDDASETRNRVFVFETLINGDNLVVNPLLQPPGNADPQRMNRYEFWYALAEFLRVPTARLEQLGRMRAALDGRENRDVLYSLAVIRQYSWDFRPGWESGVPDHLKEDEPLNKFHVAIEFIKSESQYGGCQGMTNVVRQLCFVAAKALINPGMNSGRLN